jgi:ubiquinone/menaquinone biosynthesis C-methylase UbiE
MVLQKQVWDNLYHRHTLFWQRETVSLPLLFKGKKVLELGVGNGKTLKSILKQKPKEIVAIDFSVEALKLCKNISSQHSKVLLKKTNVLHLPFPDGSFDIVVGYYIFNNLLQKERIVALKECARVLTQKGIFLFEDFAVGDFREHSSDSSLGEEHTIKKANELICHFFSCKEVKEMGKFEFRVLKCKEKEFEPFRDDKHLKRRIVSAVFEKIK